MANKKYTIGVDFGTQSGRALLVEVATGREVASVVVAYPDGVIDEKLPGTNIRLNQDWALQNPDDYLFVLRQAIPQVLKTAAVDAAAVIGVGIDFTSCTMMPVSQDGQVLCQIPQFRNDPHAWVKLWKHHAAQDQANRLNRIAVDRQESFLGRYGGKVSSEWMVPKIWQMLEEAPEIYEATFQFMEGADWIVRQITCADVKNSCSAGYKGLWHKRDGYPSKAFFRSLHPGLENLVEDKLNCPILPLGSKAGEVTPSMAKQIGLQAGTAVAVGIIDAHAAVPAATVVKPGTMVMAMGTSTCHMVLSSEEKLIEGVGGVVEDGIIPGFYGYEAGQAAVGDLFEWFISHCMPSAYCEEALGRGLSIHQLLEEKAAKLLPGGSGLLALDWWNGNRSVLVDADLTGMIVGMNLQTKAEEIYRALIEATAFGTNMIIEAFEQAGINIECLVACGGLSVKNHLFMQIYADVTGREIQVAASRQTSALGAAMFGAVAAGKGRGGYDSIVDAAAKMAGIKETYQPVSARVGQYKKLYAEYQVLHDYFGRGMNPVMKRLKELKKM